MSGGRKSHRGTIDGRYTIRNLVNETFGAGPNRNRSIKLSYVDVHQTFLQVPMEDGMHLKLPFGRGSFTGKLARLTRYFVQAPTGITRVPQTANK